MELERLNRPGAKQVLALIGLGGLLAFAFIVGTCVFMW
jgi:hypothetical protein